MALLSGLAGRAFTCFVKSFRLFFHSSPTHSFLLPVILYHSFTLPPNMCAPLCYLYFSLCFFYIFYIYSYIFIFLIIVMPAQTWIYTQMHIHTTYIHIFTQHTRARPRATHNKRILLHNVPQHDDDVVQRTTTWQQHGTPSTTWLQRSKIVTECEQNAFTTFCYVSATFVVSYDMLRDAILRGRRCEMLTILREPLFL